MSKRDQRARIATRPCLGYAVRIFANLATLKLSAIKKKEMTDTSSSPEANRPEARKPRGFQDKRAALLAMEHKLVADISAVYARWGFEALDTGPFEYVDALGKFLPDTDRPNEGVFAIQDDDEQWMALRYDHTAPLARFVAEQWNFIPKPFRRYAAGPVWRNEKPGPFRFREFIQCDADAVGVSGPAADAEMIAIFSEAMQAAGAGVGEYEIRVNTRELLDGVMQAANVEGEEQRLIVLRALDKMDKFGAEGVGLLLGPGREDESGDFTKGAGLKDKSIETLLAFAAARGASRSDTLNSLSNIASGNEAGAQGLETLNAVHEILNALNVTDEMAVFDPSIVRGLEYYTGPVFEAELLREFKDEKGRPVRFGSVGGGGRYDDLIARFTGEQVPATGMSVGVSRLAAVLAAEAETSNEKADGPVVVLALQRDHMADYCALAAELRSLGVKAEVYLGGSGMRAQMKYADRRKAPAVVIVGDKEREQGVVTVKDLVAGAKAAANIEDNAEWREKRPGQFEATRSDFAQRIRAIVEDEA